MTNLRVATGLIAFGLVVAFIGFYYVGRAETPDATPTGTPAPSPTVSSTAGAAVSRPLATPTASPAGSPQPGQTFESAILGYRITFPAGYRRASASITPGQGDRLGRDRFTPRTEQQEREDCLSDSGDIGFLTTARGEVNVMVERNPDGLSPEEWVTTPRSPESPPRAARSQVESLTINGLSAVRVLGHNATSLYVIAASGRMYEISPTLRPLEDASLDDIARSFDAMSPAPYPSPQATPTTPPEQAARAVAMRLATAFATKDADAVAREMSDCWLFVSPLVNGEPAGGVQYRSVARFIDGLRATFASGLVVTVDTGVVENPRSQGRYRARSEWREAARTSVIVLDVQEVHGRWIWFSAEPQDGYPCRRPWVDQDSC